MAKFDDIRKWYLLKPILFCSIILLFYFAAFEKFTIPRLKIEDFFIRIRYKLRPLPSERNNIVVLSIDDRSYERFNRKWPWGREVFTSLVYRLMGHQAKVIGLNLAFVGESKNKDLDLFLRDAFQDAGNVVIASYFDEEGWYHPPNEIFQDAVRGFGFTNRPKDIDGVVRLARIFMRSGSGSIMAYSYEIRLLETFLGIKIDDISSMGIPVNPDGTMKLSYSVLPKDLLTLSIIDVLMGDVPADTIKDKIILVGMTSNVFQDNHPTPLGIMSGAVIVANGFISLLRHDFIRTIPEFINYIFIILLCIAAGIITYRFTLFKSTVYFIVLGGILFLADIVIVNLGFMWDFFSIPFVMVSTYVLINIYKYARLILESMILRRAVITDPLTGLATKKYFQIKLQHDLKRAVNERVWLSLVIFSIDNFNQLVSNVGVERTDDVIKETGRTIQRYSRKSRGVDFISRYGDKEFCVILHHTPQKGAEVYSKKIQKAVRESLGKTAKITLSAGIAIYPLVKTRSQEALVQCAISALKRGEKEGTDSITLYNQELDKVAVEGYKEDAGITLYEVDMGYVISDMEERNKELVEALRNLRKAHDDIIKTERIAVMGRVTAQIHHELNKPLSNLKDCLEIIQPQSKGMPEMEKYVGLAINELERMNKLNNELRDFYRPKSKEMVSIDIHNILDEMLTLSKKHLMVNKINVNKLYGEKIPEVKGYPEELKQVFLNLIINAIDAMQGGGELTIQTRLNDSNLVEICIKDTGCGIPKENLDKLFQPFFTTKDETKGSGLGLYATKEIIERHGGRIDVESQAGSGSTFIIKLPINPY